MATTVDLGYIIGPTGPKGDTGENATTTQVATTSSNGLMSSTDKSKLDNIESNANHTDITKFLQKSGDNLSGNLVADLNSPEINFIKEKGFEVKNTYDAANSKNPNLIFLASNDKNTSGIYDKTNNEWVISKDGTSKKTKLANYSEGSATSPIFFEKEIPKSVTSIDSSLLPVASRNQLGGIKVRDGFSVSSDGYLNYTPPNTSWDYCPVYKNGTVSPNNIMGIMFYDNDYPILFICSNLLHDQCEGFLSNRFTPGDNFTAYIFDAYVVSSDSSNVCISRDFATYTLIPIADFTTDGVFALKDGVTLYPGDVVYFKL